MFILTDEIQKRFKLCLWTGTQGGGSKNYMHGEMECSAFILHVHVYMSMQIILNIHNFSWILKYFCFQA